LGSSDCPAITKSSRIATAKPNDLKRVFDSSTDGFVRLGKALMAIAEWSLFDGSPQKIVPVTLRFMENAILCRIGGDSARGSETNSNLLNQEGAFLSHTGLNDLHPHPNATTFDI
jgi:hypothetical protein